MIFTVQRKMINVWGKQYKNKITNIERKKKDIRGLVHLSASPILCMEKILLEALRQLINDGSADMMNLQERQLADVFERKGG